MAQKPVLRVKVGCPDVPPIVKKVSDMHPPRLEPRSGLQIDRTELELELIQPHMAQKPVLRGEVGNHASSSKTETKTGKDSRLHRHEKALKRYNGGRVLTLT